MAFRHSQPVAPAPPRRGGDLAFTMKFLAWAGALIGGIWALDHFFQ